MKRALALGALAAAISVVASLLHGSMNGVAADAYIRLSMMCMRLSDTVGVHTIMVAAAAGVGFAVLVLLAAASAVYQVVSTTAAIRPLRARRIPVRNQPLKHLIERLDLAGRFDLVDAPEPFAFCYGLRQPRLMLSTALVNELRHDELEAVLRHESAHLRHRDPARILIARALGVALAFIPLTPLIVRTYLCRRELTADDESVSGMGDVAPLASALQRMLAVMQPAAFRSLAVGALSATDLRIDHLLGEEQPSTLFLSRVNKVHVLTFVLLAAVAFCVLISTGHSATGIERCLAC